MANQAPYYIAHLGELRKRLFITFFTFFVFLIGAFLFVQDIYDWLIRDLDQHLAVLGPSDILWVYFMIAGVMAIALTIPCAAYQIWLFVKPGLTEKERKITLTYIPGLFLLFLMGLSFGYLIVYPTVLEFLITLSEGRFETLFTAEKYFKFMLNLTVPFGFLFEIPLIVMFLTSIGLIDPNLLSRFRKNAYFVLILIAIFITPPDFISDILVIIPLLMLYEVSITCSKLVYQKKIEKKAIDKG